MKQIAVSILAAILFSTIANAQLKLMQTVKISTPTVQCEMCKKKNRNIPESP
jgi:hypothetical protein